MNQSELEADYLLNCKRIIWLAEDIEEPTLERITTQLHYLRGKDAVAPIHVYCRCDGGDSRVGLALANLIQHDGNVQGWMIGDTASSAATIWASCAKRYVFANVRMGIHPVSWGDVGRVDAYKLRGLAGEFNKTDERQCAIYAAASNKEFNWWWNRYTLPGDVKWIDAGELVKIGMAEKAEDIK